MPPNIHSHEVGRMLDEGCPHDHEYIEPVPVELTEAEKRTLLAGVGTGYRRWSDGWRACQSGHMDNCVLVPKAAFEQLVALGYVEPWVTSSLLAVVTRTGIAAAQALLAEGA